ncbi:hypothetical protein CspeluHIS016_0201270 [Cutaneotrichosporon spelunceum]|uniref:Septin-type G domain-containing protein n=1 Tax=Cutaneotrichosporon spelunceum TaxID=1672016 RepID=A0AAD3Y9M8_9TREE|nr:hypothetical protein CspeluHIS016_0201270 [Cutaneotrichosporon spelunceum]
MPISLLRKQPSRRKPDAPVPTLAALSFPEARPLIDADWASASSAQPPTSYRHSQYSQYNTVPRTVPAPGGAGGGFGGGAAGSLATDTGRSRAVSQVRDPTGASPDFHRPFTPSRIVPVPAPPGSEVSRAGTIRRARQRRAAVLTVIVAGPSGAGKTCLIDALTGVLDPQAPRLSGSMGPTTSVVRHDINVADERRGVVLLDTPGLPLPDELRNTRARALRALINMVEDRLSRVLSEETKVVRRKSDGGELVHLIIYVMDARTILCPVSPVEIDWDTVMEPPANKDAPTRPESMLEPQTPGVEAKLSADDIEAMRQLCVRANVLPILTHADALTSTELGAVRAAVRRDLATVFGRDPLGPHGVLSAVEYEEDSGDDARDTEPDTDLPYVVFAPEPGPEFTRAFRWGRADAADPAHSDLPAVRNAIVEETDWLRQTTREVVYERFRTERLLNARGVQPKI